MGAINQFDLRLEMLTREAQLRYEQQQEREKLLNKHHTHNMISFDKLKFEPRDNQSSEDWIGAKMFFDNGYGVSVIK